MVAKYSNQKEKIKKKEIQEAAEEIKKGNLVLFPTETVYGIGANALDEKAVKKIFEAKGRAGDNPLIVHVANIQMVEELVETITPLEKKLIQEFWPGPLTVIFNRKSKEIIPNVVTANLNTVGIRMPSNKIAQELIQMAGVPIAAPSANVSGKPSGTTVEDIIEELQEKVSYILDGGFADIGLESTVIKVVEKQIVILRPGKITKEQLEKVAREVKIDNHVLAKVKKGEKVESPGMKYRHYAPNTNCMMVYGKNTKKMVDKINSITNDLLEQGKEVLILGKKQNLKDYIASEKWNMGENMEEIAKNIFALLRKVDKEKVDLVIIEGVGEKDLGLAITNRLIRACSYNYIIVE
ncbi:MAG: threonylcarbamoyl-AMP synthase [Clostridia bacterium]|nr:threonylcarbamoyl-AMP synthase [Clostridia bacterium]